MTPTLSVPTNTPTPTPSPTLYPTVSFSGNIKEYLGDSCPQNISKNSLTSININPANSTGITSNCGPTPGSKADTYGSYRCNITFNNRNPGLTPVQNFSLSVSQTGYDSAYWVSSGACTGTSIGPVNINVAGPTPANRDILFSSTVDNNPWFKFTNDSVHKSDVLNVFIPLNINPYDSDDPGNRLLVDYSGVPYPGVVSSTSTINTSTTGIISAKDWKISNYSNQKPFFVSEYLDYIKSRKTYVTVSNLRYLQTGQINFYSGSELIISNASLANYILNKAPLVLIIQGRVEINHGEAQKFNNDRKTIAILATDEIEIDGALVEANGIFISNRVNLETGGQLKINGNVISRARTDNDNSRPSFFVNFLPSMYLDLLPFFSISSYEWKQLQ